MSNQSIIEHKANMYYVEFREDYLLLCQKGTYKKPVKDGKKSKASPYCKALILAILEHWTNDKRGKGTSLAVYMSIPQWIAAMYDMFGRNVVIDSLDELIGEGLISKEPYKMFGRDSFQYLLNYTEVNRRIKALPDRDPMLLAPQVHPVTSNRDQLISKRVAVTSKPDAVTNQHDAVTSNHNIESTYIPIDSNKEESTLPALAATPTASSGDEDAHALSLSSESCSEHKEQEDSQMMVEGASTNTDAVSALAKAYGKAEPLIASATEQDEHAIAEQMKAAFPLPPASTPTRLPPRSSSKQTNKATSESGGKIVPLRETGPQFASREAAALHRKWKETYGAYGDARWDVEAIHWIAGEGGTFEDIQLIYKDLKREKATRAVKPDLVKQNWYRLHDLKHASEGQATYSNHPMMVDLSAKFGSDLSYKAMSMGR